MSTEHRGFPGAYRVKQCTIRSQFIRMAPLRRGVRGTTYPTPPFLFDLAHLSCAVSGSLLELPPRWLCPLDGEEGGSGRWQRWKGCYEGCCVRGGWDDRLGRPTPEHFHKSRVSKQASVCRKQEIMKSAHHLPGNCEYCRQLWLKGSGRLQRQNSSPERSERRSLLTPRTVSCIQLKE